MFNTLNVYCGIRHVPEALPHLKELGVGVEVVFDTTEDLWPQPRWENLLALADQIHDTGLKATVHGPFYALNMGARDEFIRDYSLKVLMSAVEFGRMVNSPLMVFHTGYIPQVPPKGRKKWLESFGECLQQLLEHAAKNQVLLAMENTYETDPSLFEEIFERYPHPNLRMCLDTGHATCFSAVPALEWPLRFADRICHVHLSDNDGRDDLHQALGAGVVDFRSLLGTLASHETWPSLTMEVAAEDARSSKEYLERLLDKMNVRIGAS